VAFPRKSIQFIGDKTFNDVILTRCIYYVTNGYCFLRCHISLRVELDKLSNDIYNKGVKTGYHAQKNRWSNFTRSESKDLSSLIRFCDFFRHSVVDLVDLTIANIFAGDVAFFQTF